jgi:hypothetical protein
MFNLLSAWAPGCLSEAYPQESPVTSLWALFLHTLAFFKVINVLSEHVLNAGLSWAQALRTAPRHNRDKNGGACLHRVEALCTYTYTCMYMCARSLGSRPRLA